MKKIILACIILLFLFLRFYQIDKSLFFFNDMGRDLLVLQEWHESGKPPLLGPQSSALPINQSPLYFYLLYPFFLLTNGSPISGLLANASLYVSFFILSFIFFKKHRSLLLFVFFLISIHPQYITQSRFVWNPSFVTPFIITSLIAQLINKQKLSGLFLAVAITFSYSVTPLLISLIIYLFISHRHQLIPMLSGLIYGLVILNLPIFIYELRHHFQLTHSLLVRGSEPQPAATFTTKALNISQYIFNQSSETFNLILIILFICVSFYIIVRVKSNQIKTISAIFLITLAVNLVIPVAIQTHYIFAFTSLIFILIGLLPYKFSLPLSSLLLIIFITPKNINTYFSPAPRTFNQMKACFQQVCRQQLSPVYISVNSNYHPFHNGPEHQYIAKISGCVVKKLENGSDQTKTMLVVADGGTYEPGRTSYFELSQFGKSKLTNTYHCLPNFTIYQITKSNSPTLPVTN